MQLWRASARSCANPFFRLLDNGSAHRLHVNHTVFVGKIAKKFSYLVVQYIYNT